MAVYLIFAFFHTKFIARETTSFLKVCFLTILLLYRGLQLLLHQDELV